MQNLDISNIISECKKDFTRDRQSVIKAFLQNNSNSVIISHISKARGDSIKLYTLQGDALKTYDYVTKNALIVIKALQNKGVKIYQYNKQNSKVTSYTE